MTHATKPVVILAVLISTISAYGEDWSQFRGPTGQGTSTAKNLPTKWDAKTNVSWKVPIAGQGWSSPIVYQGRVYVTTAVAASKEKKANQSLRVLCLDEATGQTVWNKEVFVQDGQRAPRIHGKNSHASPTPFIADQKLYVHFGHQGTACLDLDGKVVWKNSALKYAPVHGNGGSAVRVDDFMVFSTDGKATQRVLALNRNDGTTAWKADRDSGAARKFSFSTPLRIDHQNRSQIISPGSDAVCAYDPKTGRELWRVRYTGYSVVPRPVYGHGLVIISTGFDTAEILAIKPDGTGDVTDSHVAWRLKKGAPHTPSPLLVGEHLYLISDRGVATCADARSGDIKWQKRIGGNYSASPLYADGKIYLQSEQGEGVVLAAKSEFQELARNDLHERSLASYAVGDRSLLIRTANHLYRIGGKP